MGTLYPTVTLSNMLRVNDEGDPPSSILALVPSILKDKSNKPSLVPINEVSDTPTTTLDHLLYHILPEHTKGAIINGDNESPQYKAPLRSSNKGIQVLDKTNIYAIN